MRLTKRKRKLRSHGMCDDALNVIYKAVVIARVLRAIPAWWGFIDASDRQNLMCLYAAAFVSSLTTTAILHD